MGIEKQLAYYLKTAKTERKHFVNTENSFEKNKENIDSNLRLLSDEKSKKIYETIVAYRIYKKPLDKSIYSLNDQYFVEDIVQLSDNEVFVDCGAFVGDTIHHLYNYAKRTNTIIKKVIAFEPEHKNYKLLKKYYSYDHKVIPFECGVAASNSRFSLNGESTFAKIVEDNQENENTVNVVSIDEVSECQDATFIKMDIEGYEYEALKGAVNTIKRNSPKLAICLYHSNEDMIRIIPFIHEINPNYKLYIRHHSRGVSETVLYAIP